MMGELDRVEEGELTSPKAFTSFPEALSYVRRIQNDVEETYCIVSKNDGLYEVVPFVQGLQLIDFSGYRLIFAQ
ncbi:hypothetical protein GCM10023189_59640 [Nibrella saemangeumensis]|uniref:Uncharacterized protein n=1 Tax=Nibrella saemangeumensis TaxID=1084526 RepID=A0ABP8NT28_9BACT